MGSWCREKKEFACLFPPLVVLCGVILAAKFLICLPLQVIGWLFPPRPLPQSFPRNLHEMISLDI